MTLSVASGFRDPFILVTNPSLRVKAKARKKTFAEDLSELGASDHIAMLATYREFMRSKSNGGDGRKFCSDNFLSMTVLDTLHSMRKQVCSQMKESSRVFTLFDRRVPDAVENNKTSESAATISALICSATFPNFAIYRNRKWQCAGHKRVRPHPSSSVFVANGKDVVQEDQFYVFEELIRNSSGCSIRVLTKVDAIVLILFGGCLNLNGQSEEGEEEDHDCFSLIEQSVNRTEIKLNAWARFIVVDRDLAERLAILRVRMEKSFLNGVQRGHFHAGDKALSQTIHRILLAQILGVTIGPDKIPKQMTMRPSPNSNIRAIQQPLRVNNATTPSPLARPIAKRTSTRTSSSSPATSDQEKATNRRPSSSPSTAMCLYCKQSGHAWYGGCKAFNALEVAEKERLKKMFRQQVRTAQVSKSVTPRQPTKMTE